MDKVDWLFLDMNAYFASVEQQLEPSLRGRPVAVVPVLTDRTVCIAASYEARPYGIRTGTNVGQARRQCPGLQLVKARHERYVRVHHQIIEAVETVLPVHQVRSIDEMVCRLSSHHRQVGQAIEVGRRVKAAIADRVGPYLRCSVGLAPSAFLAKVATNMQKPDGLVALKPSDLPHSLYGLSLADLPGIGRSTRARLERYGVRTVRQLCELPRDTMRDMWQSVIGEKWWHLLRGQEYHEPTSPRRSIGHSHVLAPAERTSEGARTVLVRLIHKVAARLRESRLVARRIRFTVHHTQRDPAWSEWRCLGPCQDTQTMLREFATLWDQRQATDCTPLKVGVVLYDLVAETSAPLPLFEEDRRNRRAASAMDSINGSLGSNKIYFASMHAARERSSFAIAFSHIPKLDPPQTAESMDTED